MAAKCPSLHTKLVIFLGIVLSGLGVQNICLVGLSLLWLNAAAQSALCSFEVFFFYDSRAGTYFAVRCASSLVLKRYVVLSKSIKKFYNLYFVHS